MKQIREYTRKSKNFDESHNDLNRIRREFEKICLDCHNDYLFTYYDGKSLSNIVLRNNGIISDPAQEMIIESMPPSTSLPKELSDFIDKYNFIESKK